MKTLTVLVQVSVLKRTLVMFGLLCLIVTVLQLAAAMNEVLRGKLNGDDLIVSVLFGLISQSGLFLAIGYFLALFSFLTKLYGENEMHILFTMGLSERRFLLLLLPPTLLIAAAVSALAFFLTPLSATLVDSLSVTQVQRKLQNMEGGDIHFIGKDLVRLQNGNLHYARMGEEEALMIAGMIAGEKDFEATKLAGSVTLRIRNGSWLSWQPGNTGSAGSFEAAEFVLQPENKLRGLLQSRPTRELWNGNSRELAEFYQRLAVCLAVPVSLPLAMVFSRRKPRQNSWPATLGGVLCYLVYIQFVTFAVGVIRGGGESGLFWIIQVGVLGFFFLFLLPRIRSKLSHA